MPDCICCRPMSLPRGTQAEAALAAARENALNRPEHRRGRPIGSASPAALDEVAVATTRYWRSNGVHLTVGFVDDPPQALRARLMGHMNAWSRTANVAFVESRSDPQIRVAREPGAGHWSYVGTDLLLVEPDRPTMNLDGFTMTTPDAELCRVVRHQTGHAIGCAHERLPRDVVDRIDADKAVAFYGATQGWSPAEVRRQILTPVEDGALTALGHAGRQSIMGHQLPGAIMKDRQPILGPGDMLPSDLDVLGRLYPKRATTPSETAVVDQRERTPVRAAAVARRSER